MRLTGTKLHMSSTYHPQTDGQTKRLIQCLETYLRCMTFKRPQLWGKWLHLAEWWFSTTHHSTIRLSPFQALYKFFPPYHLEVLDFETPTAKVEEYWEER